MASLNHYIELIKVDAGKQITHLCGCAVAPGSGAFNLVGDTKETTVNWFGDAIVFPAGRYRLEYRGSTQFVKKVCLGCSDFIWATGRIPEPVFVNINTSVRLEQWTEVDWVDGRAAQWVVTNKTVEQTLNGSLSMFINDADFVDVSFTAQIKVKTKLPLDDDSFGVVWALRTAVVNGSTRPDSFYIAFWKREAQDTSKRGIRIAKGTGLSRLSWNVVQDNLHAGIDWSDGRGSRIQFFDVKDVAWVFDRFYTFLVDYQSDGHTTVTVRDVSNNRMIWEAAFTDTQPLVGGRIGFYNCSQISTQYSVNIHNSTTNTGDIGQFIFNSPDGSVCTADKKTITINGKSDDFVVMIHKDEEISQIYSGVAGDPITFIIPEAHIILQNTHGFFLESQGSINSSPKTFQIGDGTDAPYYMFPAGTPENRGTGGVADMRSVSEFYIKKFGEKIDIAKLAAMNWLERDGLCNFKFVFIPSGTGNVDINGITCEDIASAGSHVINWDLVVNSDGGTEFFVLNVPTVVGTSVEFDLHDPGQIGIDFVSTPSFISNPQFRLVQLDTTVSDPKQIAFIQVNNKGKPRSYRFVVSIDSRTFDTNAPSDMPYFTAGEDSWSPHELIISAHSEVVIKFNVPFPTTATTATITVYESGTPTTVVIPVTNRTFTQSPLAFHRELLSPFDPDLMVRRVALRFKIYPDRYLPYLFKNGNLNSVGWDYQLQNTDVLVCISKSVDSLTQVVHHLQTTRGILPNRVVNV